MDKIGEITDADVVCLLVGERPGLVTAESMSIAATNQLSVCQKHGGQLFQIFTKVGHRLLKQGPTLPKLSKMLDKKKSGIDLKEAE